LQLQLQSQQQLQSLPNPPTSHLYTRTSTPVEKDVTHVLAYTRTQTQTGFHQAATGPVVPHASKSTAAVPQALPPYSTANMCRHCLHHANCHYVNDGDGDTYCTACANTKCRKLSDFQGEVKIA
jgi:hypothetical protein